MDAIILEDHASCILIPEDRKEHVPLRCQFPSTRLHSVIIQKSRSLMLPTYKLITRNRYLRIQNIYMLTHAMDSFVQHNKTFFLSVVENIFLYASIPSNQY
jgi:hypothetical protein